MLARKAPGLRHAPSLAGWLHGVARRTALKARTALAQDYVAVSLGEVPTPGFTTIDLRSFWQVNDSLLLTTGVENLTGKFYREHLDPRGGFPTDLLFRPGTNYYITAQIKY